MKGRFWFRLHGWIGLNLALILGFILFTGSLATISHELDWLSTPAMRVTPQEAQTNWPAILENAIRDFPEGTVEIIHAPVAPWFAAEAILLLPAGERIRVFLDPYEGKVKGTASWFGINRLLRELHSQLMLPGRFGVPLVSSLALVMALSLVSGLMIHKHWWRGFLRLPRRNNGRIFWGDLHRLTGVWSLWFMALVALTGSWYLAQSLGAAAPPLQTAPQPGDGPVLPTAVLLEDAQPVETLLARAKAAYPALEIRELRPQRRVGDPFLFLGQAEAWLVRDRANAVALDPVTGELLWIADGRQLTLHQRIAEMADPLHFGTLGGLPTRILWFLFGLVSSGLALSGAHIFALRALGGAGHGAKRQMWRGMGWGRRPALLLIALSLVLLLCRLVA